MSDFFTVVVTQSIDNPDALVMVITTSTVSMAVLFPVAAALRRHAASAGTIASPGPTAG